MNTSATTPANHDQTDEDILNYEVSDEALEAAAGTQEPNYTKGATDWPYGGIYCCWLAAVVLASEGIRSRLLKYAHLAGLPVRTPGLSEPGAI